MYDQATKKLSGVSYTWLVTGVAGFIGSNLLEALLQLDQKVIGLDNFSTGFEKNLEIVRHSVGSKKWENFRFIRGDITNLEDCEGACAGVDYVLHQAALGSVPRSLINPIATNQSNVDGFLNMLVASRDSKIKSFVYAASSSTYGDHPGLPKVEDVIGLPLSPYAVTKYVNELYANVFSKNYLMTTTGLRYFNVFGPRQNPEGAYAAVIPKWIMSLMTGESVSINGDGETSRDFCFIQNVVQANILAALADRNEKKGHVYNIAVGERTTLNNLYNSIGNILLKKSVIEKVPEPIYLDFRDGDVRHSLADISKARREIGYEPKFPINLGLEISIDWYLGRSKSDKRIEL